MKKLTIAMIMLLFSSASMAELDLRIKDVGYRWVQNLENSEMNVMRTYMTFGVTKQDFVRFGWQRNGISDPFQDGADTVMFDYHHKFK